MNEAEFEDAVYVGVLEFALQAVWHVGCECATYIVINRDRLLPHLIAAAEKQNRPIEEIIATFIAGVHKRHLEGGNIFR